MTPVHNDRHCDGTHACYARGLRDTRRTVEAEFEAERAALAVLATSLAEAIDGLRLILHPRDGERLDMATGLLPIDIDFQIAPGSFRIEFPRERCGLG